MISDRHKFIFVHINKTGGTSIEMVFEPEADQKDVRYKHASAAYYRRKFPIRFWRYFKFAFVRNPWDWLVSRYHWSRDRQHLFDYSFAEMLTRLQNGARLADEAPWLEKEALLPQFDRLAIRGKLAVDFIGRYESLDRDFDRICTRLRIGPKALPHAFKTDHRPYVDYYDDTTRKIVEQVYARDIAAFGYRFGE
jgi:chondroitin 4-sulfotransferase 11